MPHCGFSPREVPDYGLSSIRFSLSRPVKPFAERRRIWRFGIYRERRNTVLQCYAKEPVDVEDALEAVETPKERTLKVCCYGCGVELQTRNASEIGYIDPKKFETKLHHKQYSQLLCSRCVLLTHGKMVAAIDDRRHSSEKHHFKNLLSPEELKEQLKSVRHKKVLVVLLVDLLDLPGSLLNSIRPLIGMNPIIFIGTKADLLPKYTPLPEVGVWLRDCAVSKRLNVVDVHLVSNRNKMGITPATSSILRTRNGRDVYVMGLANVGKSAFVRALLTEMRTLTSSNFTVDAFAKGRFLPVESSMPGTTLGIIKLRALKRKGAIYDTPGVHVFHRLTHLLAPEDLRKLLPGRPLSPYIPPSPYEICKQLNQREALVERGETLSDEELVEKIMEEPDHISATYFWGGLIRIDIFEAPSSLGLVFFGASVLKVHSFPLLRSDATAEGHQTEEDVLRSVINGEMMDRIVSTRFLQNVEGLQSGQAFKPVSRFEDLNSDLLIEDATLPVCAVETPESSVGSHEEAVKDEALTDVDLTKAFFGRDCVLKTGWAVAKSFEIECQGFEENLADISVSGLPGWISLAVPHMIKNRDRRWLRGRVWAPKGVEVFLRTPIPVVHPLNRDVLR